MPTSTRHRTVAATIVGCLSTLALGATPAGASAQATRATGAVSVSVAASGQVQPVYRIAVRNTGPATAYTTLRQQLPTGATVAASTDEPQVRPPTGRAGGPEVVWRLRVPAGTTRTVASRLGRVPVGGAVAAPACAYGAGEVPYDCASATWSAARAAPAGPVPWWRRPLAGAIGAAVLAGLLLLAAGLLARHRVVRRRRARDMAVRQIAVDSDPSLYPRQVRPPTPAWRAALPSRPPGWLVIGGAATVVAGLVAIITWATTARVAAIDVERQPTSGAWVGRGAAGPVGAALRESAFEFTVYRLTCGRAVALPPRPASPSTAPAPSGPAGSPAPAGPSATPGASATPDASTAPGASATPVDPGAPGASGTPGAAGSGRPGAPGSGPGTPQAGLPRPKGQQCRAVVGVRNVSGRDHLWYGTLQRAYEAGGNWVSADEPATQAANGGRDPFATAVPAGSRRILPLVFTMTGDAPPTQLELRSAVFSAGVRIDVH